jgi:hypothetical protein
MFAQDYDMATPAKQIESEQPGQLAIEGRTETQIRKVASWIAIIGTSVFAGYFFGFLIYHSAFGPASPANWFTRVLEAEFAATIGVPLSAISAACIVLLLKAATGPIEFEALGFKFRGASGPIVLWVFCFLEIIAGMKLLWR